MPPPDIESPRFVEVAGYQDQIMKQEFKTLQEGVAWITLHAITQLHLTTLSEELASNHHFTKPVLHSYHLRFLKILAVNETA